jgi:hypothetical protein
MMATQICMSVSNSRYSDKDRASAAGLALELGFTHMLELVVPVMSRVWSWSLVREWNDLFNTACQVRALLRFV